MFNCSCKHQYSLVALNKFFKFSNDYEIPLLILCQSFKNIFGNLQFNFNTSQIIVGEIKPPFMKQRLEHGLGKIALINEIIYWIIITRYTQFHFLAAEKIRQVSICLNICPRSTRSSS